MILKVIIFITTSKKNKKWKEHNYLSYLLQFIFQVNTKLIFISKLISK